MAFLAVNAGSSSLKVALFDANAQRLKRWHVSGLPNNAVMDCAPFPVPTGSTALSVALDAVKASIGSMHVACIGHRIVHGGQFFDKPVALTPDVMEQLASLTALAPQHQPANLAGVKATMAHWPEATQIGVFDTAFHRTQPRTHIVFPLPLRFEEQGYIRYGFHGLSYQYIVEEIGRRYGQVPKKMIVAHLGAGCSMAAIADGKSVATTMGFTALDGLPMGTRSGAIDPGLVLHLIEHGGMSAGEVHTLLYKNAGLKGLSGMSGDMREITASDAPAAKLARAVFIHHCVKEIGGLFAVLGGCDMLVLTGGIGENDTALETALIDKTAALGIPAYQRVPTDEEQVIANACRDAFWP